MQNIERMEMNDQNKLDGKVAIVTGATSGMGKAIAEIFAQNGAAVVLSGRNREKGNALKNQLIENGHKATFLSGDISKRATCEALVDAAVSMFGKIDLLSLNAGILGLGKVTELPETLWHNTINTNLSSIYYLCKAALPEMLKQESGSILVNASIAAYRAFPNHPAYCASKAGAVALARQMAVDYGPRIRVNAICPGPVDTPLLWDSVIAFDHPESAVSEARESTLLKRLGDPADIAKLALFLVSDDASWITGSAFRIDGGIMS